MSGGQAGETAMRTGTATLGTQALHAAPAVASAVAPAVAETGKTLATEGAKAASGATKEGMSDIMKSALITGGLGAGAGLATGLASALMAEDPKEPGGHTALPSGSPGNVKGTAGTQMSFGRSNLPQNKDYALAMLQGRRF